MITTALRLGDLLLGQRLITADALSAALAAQVVHGGRLGTNLVELGALSIDHVALALGEQHGVPAASHPAFEAVPSSALGAMPRELCQQYTACPLLLEGQTLHVAFLDPDQLSAIDAVGRIVGFTIHAYAAPEIRLLYYLEKHYQIQRPKRYLRVTGEPRERDRRRYLRPMFEPSPPPPESTAGEAQPPTAPTRSLRPKLPGLAVSTESGTFELEVVEQRSLDARRGDDPELARLVDELEAAASREELIRLALRPVVPDATLAVLFLVRDGSAVALGAWGTTAPPEEVRSLVIPLASPLVRRAMASRGVTADSDADGDQRQIAARLLAPPPRGVYVVPVCVEDVPVNLLCVHSARLPSDDACARLQRLGSALARGYRRLLSRRQTASVAAAGNWAQAALWAESSSWSGWGPAKPLARAPLAAHVGRYEVLCRFASGGMANLYLARLRGPGASKSLVAIKRIHEHLSDQAGFVERFEDEARLAARINHPNVVNVIEYGRVGRSQFIAMEYVDGESLATLLNAVTLQLPLCARIIVDAAAGLHAAHELRSADGQPLQVVHRDVSPHNLLIAYDGTVKVVDFGVAHARSNVHTSFVGVIAGKPAYMAPEQARGQDLDRRVDIFALGIILHEMTTRRRLFQGVNQADTLVNVLTAPVPPPSRIVPDYPPALERIVMKALERDPDRRFATAEQMRLALDRYIASATPMPATALGKLMRSVFAERMAQKRELLRGLVAGIT